MSSPSSTVQFLATRMMQLLGRRPHSVAELRRKLIQSKTVQKKLAGDTAPIDEALNVMKSHGFLNDEEFAKWFVDRRGESRPRSSIILRTELKMRGVKQDDVETAMMNYSEEEACLKQLTKRLRIKSTEPREKTFQHLKQKGFSTSQINRAFDSVAEQKEQQESNNNL